VASSPNRGTVQSTVQPRQKTPPADGENGAREA
jgi:hypothetical protein